MKFYTGKSFDDFAEEYRQQISKEINSQADSYILNVNIDDYKSHLVQRYTIDIPEFQFDKVFVDTTERDVPSSRFPAEFMFSDEGKSVRKQVIIYHIPYTGNIDLLQLRPNPYALMSYDATIDARQRCILIHIINYYNDPEKIKQQYNQEIGHLSSNYGYLRINLQGLNNSLEQTTLSLLDQKTANSSKK